MSIPVSVVAKNHFANGPVHRGRGGPAEQVPSDYRMIRKSPLQLCLRAAERWPGTVRIWHRTITDLFNPRPW